MPDGCATGLPAASSIGPNNTAALATSLDLEHLVNINKHLVDPILPLIGRAMGATPSQVELPFTSYIAVMALAMLISGMLGRRSGGKHTA